MKHGDEDVAVCESWVEVKILYDDRNWEIAGYFPTLSEAKREKITGWYGSPPEYHKIKVLWFDGKVYKVQEIKHGKL